MSTIAERLGASKAASCLLVLFIPSKDRADELIEQDFWVQEALSVLGKLFGGATAFPQGKGVWRDDAQGGRLLFDQPVVIQVLHQRGRVGAGSAGAPRFPATHGARGETRGHRPGDRPRLPRDRLPVGDRSADQEEEKEVSLCRRP